MKSAVGTAVLYAPTSESLEVDIYCSSDPTGTVPGFAITARGTMITGSTTFTSGTWAETYGSDGWTKARTPTLGTSGSLTITAGTYYWLWASVTAGSETAKWLVGTIVVPS